MFLTTVYTVLVCKLISPLQAANIDNQLETWIISTKITTYQKTKTSLSFFAETKTQKRFVRHLWCIWDWMD